jgi:hypothetical protein
MCVTSFFYMFSGCSVHFYKSYFVKEVLNYVGLSKIFAVAIKFCFILKQRQPTIFALNTAVCLQTPFLLI